MARRHGLVGIMVTVVVALGFRSAVADWYDVPTGSMQPTILIGDRIFVNKLAYDLKVPFVGTRLATWGDPVRGDIVVCSSPVDGTRLVKRIIAGPGDEVAMRDGRLWINGEPLDYAADPAVGLPMGESGRGMEFGTERLGGREHPVAATPWRRAVRDFGPLTVPADRFFVMGDNRDNSGDSRHWGFVERDAVAGRALGLVMSLDRQDGWRPRWSRFGRQLS
jgi:signal peptidase I